MAAKKNNNNGTATQTPEQQTTNQEPQQTQPVKPIEIDEEANRILQQQIARQMNQGQQQATAKKNQKPASEQANEMPIEAAPTADEEQKPEIPTRKNWDLEGIIPFKDFMEMDFPESLEADNKQIEHLWYEACRANRIDSTFILQALYNAPKMKKKSLKKITDKNETLIFYIKHGFSEMTKWMSLYAAVASTIFNKNDLSIPAPKTAVKAIKKLIKEEIKTGEFHPIDEMVLKANGWDKTNLKPATDEREQIKNAITTQFRKLTDMLQQDMKSDIDTKFMMMIAGDLEEFFKANADKYADKALELAEAAQA